MSYIQQQMSTMSVGSFTYKYTSIIPNPMSILTCVSRKMKKFSRCRNFFLPSKAIVHDRSPITFMLMVRAPLNISNLCVFSLPFECVYVCILRSFQHFLFCCCCWIRIVILYTQYSNINIQPQLSKFTHPQNFTPRWKNSLLLTFLFSFPSFFFLLLNADTA